LTFFLMDQVCRFDILDHPLIDIRCFLSILLVHP
jgi:hypothetical protein